MGPGGFDMQQIFAAAQQALSAQQELANSELTGTAGGGAVRAVVSGVGQLLDVTIDPSVIDPADPAETAATIADLVLAAVRDAWDSAVDLQQRAAWRARRARRRVRWSPRRIRPVQPRPARPRRPAGP